MLDPHSDDGSMVLEFVVASASLLLIVLALVAGGRIIVAGQITDAAAAAAARSASLARDAHSGARQGNSLVQQMILAEGGDCQRVDVAMDVAGFMAPVGNPAEVHATVVCTLNVADVAVPGLPGEITLTRTASSPLDRYRGRQ